jgi:hypothetical protein
VRGQTLTVANAGDSRAVLCTQISPPRVRFATCPPRVCRVAATRLTSVCASASADLSAVNALRAARGGVAVAMSEVMSSIPAAIKLPSLVTQTDFGQNDVAADTWRRFVSFRSVPFCWGRTTSRTIR